MGCIYHLDWRSKGLTGLVRAAPFDIQSVMAIPRDSTPRL